MVNLMVEKMVTMKGPLTVETMVIQMELMMDYTMESQKDKH